MQEALNRLAMLASKFVGAPTSLVTLVEEDRQLIVGHAGNGARPPPPGSMPLEYSYCRHALGSDEPLLIQDARRDPRVAGSPAIRENASVAYAGVPLRTEEGHTLGTLCVIDTSPRVWTDEEVEVLRALAASVMTEIDLRRDIGRRIEAEEALRRQAALLDRAADHLEDEVRSRMAALEKSEQRFRALIENSSEIISVVSEDGMVEYDSPAVERILGYSPAELEGRSGLELVHPEDEPHVAEAFARLVEEGAPIHVEYRCRRKDGTWAVMHSTGTNLLQDPAVRGVVVNSRDITQLRQGEERLRQAEKMEAIGRLAGGIAHDFNNILNVIIGAAHLLMMDLPEDSPARPDVEEIDRAAERAAGLTRQLLSFARQQVLQPELLDLNKLIEGIGKMLRRTLGEHIDFRMVLSEDLGRVKADRGQIEQILMNLAVNARDAMPRGGTLIIETREVDLGSAFSGQYGHEVVPGRYVMLAISDTGSGMRREVRERIFEPFYTTKELGQGTGLGLSTVYGIVKQAGGYIWVYSEEGRGTTFKIFLPRVDVEASPPAGPDLTGTARGRGERILLVEDEDGVRAVASRVLRAAGFRVLEAGNGEEAIQIAAQLDRPVDLLLTDMIMPRMGGKELAERLWSDHPQLRVLFTSGYTDEAIVHHAPLPPGIAFLQKPYAPAALLKKVAEALGGRPEPA